MAKPEVAQIIQKVAAASQQACFFCGCPNPSGGLELLSVELGDGMGLYGDFAVDYLQGLSASEIAAADLTFACKDSAGCPDQDSDF